ncbi:MAG: arsenate reductase [Halioglobus sp.]|jgi:arsenate reductase
METKMSEFTIYHNPRCSKSRATLALLEEHGLAPAVVLYLESPLTFSDIKGLLKKLGMSAADIVRRGEVEYKEAGLQKQSSEADIIAAIAAHAKLLERPIVVRGDRAVVGRPPENVLALIN